MTTKLTSDKKTRYMEMILGTAGASKFRIDFEALKAMRKARHSATIEDEKAVPTNYTIVAGLLNR